MRKILEDFYYGDLSPSARVMAPNSELLRMVGKAADCEEQLLKQLDETGQKTLSELVDAQHTMDSITGIENFILGFRLGVRMMLECMDDNDGDIREVTDDG